MKNVGWRAAALERAEELRALVTPIAGRSLRAIAEVLNARGIKTPRGSKWASPQVMRLLDRLGLGPRRAGA